MSTPPTNARGLIPDPTMPDYPDEYDLLADDGHDILARATVVVTNPKTLGTLDHATGLRVGATSNTTAPPPAAIRARRGPLTVRTAGPGEGAGRVEEAQWVVKAAEVVDVTTSLVFVPAPQGTLAETGGGTYHITRVSSELDRRQYRLFASRQV